MPREILDVGEDRRRYDEFKRTQLAVPIGEVKAWTGYLGLEG